MGGGDGDGGAASETTTPYASTMRHSLSTVSDHTRGEKNSAVHTTHHHGWRQQKEDGAGVVCEGEQRWGTEWGVSVKKKKPSEAVT